MEFEREREKDFEGIYFQSSRKTPGSMVFTGPVQRAGFFSAICPTHLDYGIRADVQPEILGEWIQDRIRLCVMCERADKEF
jgi:hypothetical protein